MKVISTKNKLLLAQWRSMWAVAEAAQGHSEMQQQAR
jgi:hypothetical protein